MARMGRPYHKATVVLRVSIARPARKDSRVIWTSSLTYDDLKKKYGDNLLSVDEYHLDRRVYQRKGHA